MAKLKYTFDDYINNPSGKGSAVIASINKDQFNKELIGLESNNGKSSYTVYKQIKSGGIVSYVIHFLIPSNTKNFFHDVVVEFTPKKDDSTTNRTIKNHTVRFFSNDSNFVFTYAYTFKSHGVLITELEKLLPFRSTVQKPTMRNPDNAMGYNKSIVFAYLIMQRNGLFAKDTLNRLAKNAGINVIRANILPFDKKEQERKKITQEAKEAGEKEKRTPANKVIKSKNLLGDKLPSPPKISKIVGNSKMTKKVSSVKKSKKR
jgi:hypothetical protein